MTSESGENGIRTFPNCSASEEERTWGRSEIRGQVKIRFPCLYPFKIKPIDLLLFMKSVLCVSFVADEFQPVCISSITSYFLRRSNRAASFMPSGILVTKNVIGLILSIYFLLSLG